MKKLINELKFGKNTKISAVLAMLIFTLVVLGCSNAEKPAAPPTEAESQTLVKNTMSEFADAVDKGDFAAFKANTAKEFQTMYTDDQMKTSFKTFTDQKEAIVPILRDAAKRNTNFSPAPAVRDEKGYSVLTANGVIDSEPQAVKITNEYVYQDSKWKLLKFGIVLQ